MHLRHLKGFMLFLLFACSSDAQRESPPKPTGNFTFEGTLTFNGASITPLKNGTVRFDYWNKSNGLDTMKSLNFSAYEFYPAVNSWEWYYALNVRFSSSLGDTLFLSGDLDGPNTEKIDQVSLSEKDYDVLFTPWVSDTGFYSIQLNSDSSFNAYVEARLVRDHASRREPFLTDTIDLFLDGIFIPR